MVWKEWVVLGKCGVLDSLHLIKGQLIGCCIVHAVGRVDAVASCMRAGVLLCCTKCI